MTAYNGNMIYYDGMTTLGSFKVGNPTTYNNGTAWTFTWEHGLHGFVDAIKIEWSGE